MSNLEELPAGISLKVNFLGISDVQRQLASRFLVHYSEGLVTINMFEVDDPFFIGTDEEKRQVMEDLKKRGAVDAKCIGRFVVTPDKLKDLIRALREMDETIVPNVKAKQD